MARFSQKNVTSAPHRSAAAATSQPMVENLAKGQAYAEGQKLELVSTMLTSFVEDQSYRGRDKVISRLLELVDSIEDKRFVAQAAVFARTKFGMRSVSHLAAAGLAKRVKGQPWMGPFLREVVIRPDDITEILSAYTGLYGFRPLPNMLKQRRGLAGAFAKFDRYQLSKYREETRGIKMVDAVNLLHPKPSSRNGQVQVPRDEYWKALSDQKKEKVKYEELPEVVGIPSLEALTLGLLKSPETWEVLLTQAGSDPKAKAAVWEKLVAERKIGYMALLMNLRNIKEQAPHTLPKALEMLTDPELIRKSLVLPYRFSKAYSLFAKQSGTQEILKALGEAAEVSLERVPRLPGKTLVALDVSGSMEGKPFEIGAMFAVVLAKANMADLIIFSNGAKYLTINPAADIFTAVEMIRKHSEFSGTNFHAVFDTANQAYERIILLSDMQGWIGYTAPKQSFQRYQARHKADPKVWSFNLNDYGTLMFPEENVYCLAGWSEKILEVMAVLEQNPEALLDEIRQIQL